MKETIPSWEVIWGMEVGGVRNPASTSDPHGIGSAGDVITGEAPSRSSQRVLGSNRNC